MAGKKKERPGIFPKPLFSFLANRKAGTGLIVPASGSTMCTGIPSRAIPL